VNAPHAAARLRRTLAAVYRFHDAFHAPVDERTPPIRSPLEVSIPALRWNALRVEDDASYRFSAATLTQAPPSGGPFQVRVSAPAGDYRSLEDIVLNLPRWTPPAPPKREDFLMFLPLWPTPALRPPPGETAVRGHIFGPPALPVEGIKVEMWPGNAPTPPAGTPYTRSNADGDFLFRFPLLKGAPGQAATFGIRLDGGLIAVAPASLSIVLGQTQIIRFQRT
jgi:hypothetical protein